MRKLMGVIVAFAIIAILAFLTINWVSAVPPPSNQSSAEYEVYTNLTDTADLAFTGQEAVMLLVVVVMVFSAFMLLWKWFS